jgi:hypothetical protein
VPLALGDSVLSKGIGAPSLSEAPNYQQRTQKRQYGSEPSRKYLFFGGISSPFLGLQIFGVMLIGFGFACLSMLGITRALDDPDRQRRIFGWVWLCVGCAGGLFFYGWAWGGNPLLVWGLG